MNRRRYNEPVLSYHESLLRESDIDLLRGPHWLNDSVISFYFEFLECDFFKNNAELLFISPEVTQCIKISPPSELHIFLDPLLQHQQKSFIFFALNDNERTEYSGGSHWSLLVFSRPEKMVFHFDSSKGSNDEQAVEFSEKLLKYFHLPVQAKYEEVPWTQQNNGYDCGVHVLCNAEHLACYAAHYGKIKGCPKISIDKVKSKRYELLDIIERLRHHER